MPTVAPKRLSQKGYAAHRRTLRLPGCTLPAIHEAIRLGRIPTLEDGWIDPEAADTAWEANTDASRRPNNTSNGHAGTPDTYIEAKRLESIERARQLRLENEQTEGDLVRASEVELAWARRIVEARNHLRGIPSRAKMRLPSLTAADLQVLAALVDEALEELANARDTT